MHQNLLPNAMEMAEGACTQLHQQLDKVVQEKMQNLYAKMKQMQ